MRCAVAVAAVPWGQTCSEATVARSNLEHTTVLSKAVSCFYTLKAARYEISGLVSRQTDLPS